MLETSRLGAGQYLRSTSASTINEYLYRYSYLREKQETQFQSVQTVCVHYHVGR